MIPRSRYTVTHHRHLGEGALDTVGHGHSGWTHVSVGLYKVVNGSASKHEHTDTRLNEVKTSLYLTFLCLAMKILVT